MAITCPGELETTGPGDLLQVNHNPLKMSKASLFLGQEAAFEIQWHQSEIKHLISQHSKRLRLELKDIVKKQSKVLLSSIHNSVVINLIEKDDEIQKLRKMNWLLQEKVKSLAMENQIWRGLAQTNETASNFLHSNLKHALACGCEDDDDDIESYCRRHGGGGGVEDGAAEVESRRRWRWCKVLGERESSVLSQLAGVVGEGREGKGRGGERGKKRK